MNEISQHGGKLRNQEQRLQLEIDAKHEVMGLFENMKTQLRLKEAEYLVSQEARSKAQSSLGQANVIISFFCCSRATWQK